MTLIRRLRAWWRDTGIVARLAIVIGVVALVGTAVQAQLFMSIEREHAVTRHREVLEETATSVVPLLAEQAVIGDYASLHRLLEATTTKRSDIGHIVWRDHDGREHVVRAPGRDTQVPRWFAAWSALGAQTTMQRVGLGGTYYGELEIHTTPQPVLREMWEEFLRLTVLSGVVSVLAFLAIVALLRANLRSLARLAAAAERMRQGGPSLQVPVEGPPESRLAIEAFNRMSTDQHRLVRELKRSRAALHEQLHFTEALFEAIPLPVFFKDRDGIYLGVNKAWEQFFGVPRGEVIGRTVEALYPHDPATARMHAARDAVLWADPGTQSYETPIVTRDGRRFAAMYAKATFTRADGAVAGLIGVITDLTTLKAAEEQARQALVDKLSAEAASEAKSAFLAHMSHEIRTPLTAIIGFSESLLERAHEAGERTEAVNTIVRAGRHLLGIINDILDVSKIEAGRLEVERIATPLFPMLQDLRALAAPQAEAKGLVFRVDVEFPLPATIVTDPVRFKQILINLVSNAIKFTDKGSVSLQVKWDAPTQQLVCRVVDTGIGLNAEQRKRLFRSFTQAESSTTRRYGGTGLGLYLCKHLAEALGGSIGVEGTEGQGSTFTVTLATGPAAAADLVHDFAEAAGNEAGRDIPGPALCGHVLVADDNPDNQALVSRYLRAFGLEVSLAGNGAEAVALASQRRFDLVLMDMQMPEVDGVEAVRRLRVGGYSGRIVALTADATRERMRECEQVGCDGFLSKPIDRRRFGETVRRHLAPLPALVASDKPIVSTMLNEAPEAGDLVETYVHHLAGTLAELARALAARQWETAKTIAHDLKGGCGNFGFPLMAALAAAIEDEIAMDNHAALEGLLRQMETAAERMRRGVSDAPRTPAEGNAA